MRRPIGLAALAGSALVAVALTGAPAVAAPASNAGAAPAREAAASGPALLTADAARLDPNPAVALEKYWTPARMAAAIPADRLSGDPAKATVMPSLLPSGHVGGSAPSKLATPPGAIRNDVTTAARWPNQFDTPAYSNGKVFFTQNGSGFVCSGAVINSEARNTVFTAGHCVHGGSGGTFHTNWTFVPNYLNNNRPVGTWSARQLWSLNGWMNNSDRAFDIGAVVMFNNAAGSRIADVTGSQGIEWNGSRGQFVYHWGYPANAPYNGESLQYCNGTTFNTGFLGIGGDLGLACTAQGGASGGAWVRAFNGVWGYEISINSYHVGNDLTKIYGPYFGDGAANLYNAVRNLV
jgi:V8-like Glu-specific endopeptidase